MISHGLIMSHSDWLNYLLYLWWDEVTLRVVIRQFDFFCKLLGSYLFIYNLLLILPVLLSDHLFLDGVLLGRCRRSTTVVLVVPEKTFLYTPIGKN